jgi:hypothetical protein
MFPGVDLKGNSMTTFLTKYSERLSSDTLASPDWLRSIDQRSHHKNKYPHFKENSGPTVQDSGSQVALWELGRRTKLAIPNRSRTNSSRSTIPVSRIMLSRRRTKGKRSIHRLCGFASCSGVGRRDSGRDKYSRGDGTSSFASGQLKIPCITPCWTRAE